MADKRLDKFGEFVMKKLRDPAINNVEGLLRSHWKAPALKKLQSSLTKLTPKEKELVRRCVVQSIDTAIHDFLFAVQERADFENDIEIRVDGKNIVPLSDGIHGEAYGDEGWQARFSDFGAAPDEA
jgi:hypothetical protein